MQRSESEPFIEADFVVLLASPCDVRYYLILNLAQSKPEALAPHTVL